MRGRLLIVLISVSLLVAGCSASSQEEVQAWMQAQKNEMRPRVTPIAEPKPYKPEEYASVNLVDPFNKEKLLAVFRRDSGQNKAVNNSLVAPELARRKQALEAYPLDSMSMVGSLVQEGQPAALLKVDKQLYQVRVGNYLGTNFGKVVKIAETEIVLREIVQDSVGEWVERMATLQLQENAK
jgi:type IV pilus assembly protein PilP